MATIQIILSILLLFGYTVTFCIKTGGVPSSLSASVFDLPMNKRWIWTVMLCSQVVLVLNQPWLLLCWLPFVITWMIVGKWRTKTFWAEMVCFVSTFAFCLI